MIILGGLGLLMGAFYIFMLVSGYAADAQFRDSGVMAARIVNCVLGLIWGAIVIFGGFQMRALKARGSVITAAIFAMLPCNVCCILGIPVGAWALVTVSQPDVKDAFQ